MIIIVALAALVIGGLLAAGIVLAIIEAVRRLFWLGLRLLVAGAVALVGAVMVASAAGSGHEWVGAPVLLTLAAAVLWLTRGWGREPEGASASASATPRPPAGSRLGQLATPMPPTSIGPAPLIDAALHRRLAATEAALGHGARDDLGAPAAEWLTFWRRRVPDLIAAAQGVYDDADDTEKPAVAARLADHLGGIVDEADRRLAAVSGARRDLFATRGAHADGRVREG